MLQPTETSYFSQPAAGLDPRLFKNGKLTPTVRMAVLQLLNNHLNSRYTGANEWSAAWLAGSGVSYQWAAQREPGDLDCLITVDFLSFRQSNAQYLRLSDREIAEMLNEGFREALQPSTGAFMGSFELTFYAITSPRITDIKPYAAYSLSDDDWTVVPQPIVVHSVAKWDTAVAADKKRTIDALTKFISAKSKYESASNEAVKANARSEMRVAMAQASQIYDEIHGARGAAFGPSGAGYLDFANYRWQANKQSGAIQALRAVKSEMEAADAASSQKLYGVDLPDARTLIRRAASSQQ